MYKAEITYIYHAYGTHTKTITKYYETAAEASNPTLEQIICGCGHYATPEIIKVVATKVTEKELKRREKWTSLTASAKS